MKLKQKRFIAFVCICLSVIVYGLFIDSQNTGELEANSPKMSSIDEDKLARTALDKLEVRKSSTSANYSRDEFGGDWAGIKGCDLRNLILQRDLKKIKIDKEDGCTVLSGSLLGPYTDEEINFSHGVGSSNKVHIDHVVALSDAWKKGAQNLSYKNRDKFANDSLNLLAIDGQANIDKSDSDAASWLPPNEKYRCRYVARQIAVKVKYSLWVTKNERSAMERVLGSCPTQQLPKVSR